MASVSSGSAAANGRSKLSLPNKQLVALVAGAQELLWKQLTALGTGAEQAAGSSANHDSCEGQSWAGVRCSDTVKIFRNLLLHPAPVRHMAPPFL